MTTTTMTFHRDQCGQSLHPRHHGSKSIVSSCIGNISSFFFIVLLLCSGSNNFFDNLDGGSIVSAFTSSVSKVSFHDRSRTYQNSKLTQQQIRIRSTTLHPPTVVSSTNVSVSDVEDDTTSTDIPFMDMKSQLIRMCQKKNVNQSEMKIMINQFEDKAEQYGIGQSSAISGLLNGEWELLYSSTDKTRSSPFFWAFRKAFTDTTADQIYDITDQISSPLKDLGPAFQRIDYTYTGNANIATGKFVSQIKIATLNGIATSIMTTRGTIIGLDGIDGIKIKIDTTKPEQSTIISTLFGPLGDVINENLPAFPSGDVLERVMPKSSEVIIRTTYCDDTIRISRNNERLDDEFFIFKRREFASYDFL